MLARAPRPVILAGDLGIRDPEELAVREKLREELLCVNEIGDAWVHCGSPHNMKHTWDTSTNSNLGVLKGVQGRFDRVLYTLRSPCGMTPNRFDLLGKRKVDGLYRFPSDHWGIHVTWTGSRSSRSEEDSAPTQEDVALTPSRPGAQTDRKLPSSHSRSADRREEEVHSTDARPGASTPTSPGRRGIFDRLQAEAGGATR